MSKDLSFGTRLILFLLIAGAAWFLVIWYVGPFQLGSPELRNGTAFSKASYAWSATDLEGKKIDFSEFQGKTVFLNVWATWCNPCIKEMPSINDLAARPELKDVRFVYLSVDDELKLVKNFVRATPLKGQTLWLGEAELPQMFQTPGIPATFIIGPDGSIVSAHTGSANWNSDTVVELLKKLSGKAS